MKKTARVSLPAASKFSHHPRGGDVAQLVQRRTSRLLRQVRFPSVARNFFPQSNFQRRLSYSVRTPLSAATCINICVLVKDSVVHVRVQWIIETLKQQACTVGWVVQLCGR